MVYGRAYLIVNSYRMEESKNITKIETKFQILLISIFFLSQHLAVIHGDLELSILLAQSSKS